MTSAAGQFMKKNPPVSQDAAAWLATRPRDAAPAWIAALRETAAEVFSATGLPDPSWEAYKYTQLRPLAEGVFSYQVAAAAFDAALLPPPAIEGSARIVCVNGQLQVSLSAVPAGVRLVPLMSAAEVLPGVEEQLASVGDLSENPIKALNAAHCRDGFVLDVPAGQKIDQPVEVVFLTTAAGVAAYPRIYYRLGDGAEAVILERFIGAQGGMTNLHAEISVGKGASLKLYRDVEGAGKALFFLGGRLQVAQDGRFEGFSLATGTAAARQKLRMELIGKAISSSIGGIYLLRGHESHDFTVLADHMEPDCTSAQHFKGVIDDQARSVFQGKIHVRRIAQKTDGYQSHHALLLSEQAQANTKPELEIYADDVKCSHGTTAGMLDAEALFYLRSRGIPEQEARGLLIQSFLAETLERLTDERAVAFYAARIGSWLAGQDAKKAAA